MDNKKEKNPDFSFLISDLHEKPKQIGTDKGLAKIGDGIVNFAYSVAKSIYLTQYKNDLHNPIREGEKVNKYVLSNALKNANMREYAKTRPDSHDLANTYESLIAYVWLNGKISLKEIIEFVAKQFKDDINDYKLERANSIEAFTNLMNNIKKFIPKSE
jgi:uncharacterized membrane protein YkoI